MGTTLSTLSNLAIYIGLVVVGAFLGSRKALRSRPLVWVGKLQFAALMILIVTLGVNLGANDEVVSSPISYTHLDVYKRQHRYHTV